MSTYYALLGVRPTADSDEIKRAVRDLMLANHPDKTHHLPKDERANRETLAKQVNNAWECLRDVQRKREYDIELLKLEQLERQRRREEMAQTVSPQPFEMASTPGPDDTDGSWVPSMDQRQSPETFEQATWWLPSMRQSRPPPQPTRRMYTEVPARGFAQAYQAYYQNLAQDNFQGHHKPHRSANDRMSPQTYQGYDQLNPRPQPQPKQETCDQFVPQSQPQPERETYYQHIPRPDPFAHDQLRPQPNPHANDQFGPQTYQPTYDQVGPRPDQHTPNQVDPQSRKRNTSKPTLPPGYTMPPRPSYLSPRKVDEAQEENMIGQRTPHPRRDNTININTRGGWELTITISKKYFVVDNSVVEKGGRTSPNINIAIKLEPDPTWVKPIHSTPDVHLKVEETPTDRDVTSISSLYHYATLHVPHTNTYHTLSLTLKAGATTLLPLHFNFGYDVSPVPPFHIPSKAQSVATHYIFSKAAPKEVHRKYEEQDKLDNIPLQCPEFELARVLGGPKRFEILGQGVGQSSARFGETFWDGRKWFKLGCTGVSF